MYEDLFFNVLSNVEPKTIAYQRGVLVVSDIPAVVTLTEIETEIESGVLVVQQAKQFLVPASSLTDFVSPKIGDKVVFGSHAYSVITPVFQWADSNQTYLKIYTSLV